MSGEYHNPNQYFWLFIEFIHKRILFPYSRCALKLIKEHNCESVLFGASSPLGLLSSRLKSNGVKKTVALTHGHEVGWAFTPGLKQTFQKIVKDVDKLTYLTKFTYEKISEANHRRFIKRI